MAEPTFAMDPFRQAFGHKSGRYYGPTAPGANSTRSVTLDTLCLAPIIVSRPTTYDRIGIEITTLGATSVQRLGIYASLPEAGFPNKLVLDAGTVDGGSTGFKEIVINLALSQGVYWLAVVPQVATSTVRAIASATSIIPFGMASGAESVGASLLELAGISGALPSLWSASGTTANGALPRVLLRAA